MKKKKKNTKPFKSFEYYEKVALKKLTSWNPFYVVTKLKVFAAQAKTYLFFSYIYGSNTLGGLSDLTFNNYPGQFIASICFVQFTAKSNFHKDIICTFYLQ